MPFDSLSPAGRDQRGRLRDHLHPDGQGLPLPGGDHGLGEPCRAGVAAVEHARRGVLCRGPRRSALPVRPSRDLQHRPEPAPAKAGGSQFTSDDFTGTLQRHGVTISMDGKGRYMDNIFVERLWRSLKYEEVYLNAYASVAEATAGIGSWLGFYNEERQPRAWATAHRARPTKQNAGGYVDDRLRRPAAPSPTSPPAQPPTTELILTRQRETVQ